MSTHDRLTPYRSADVAELLEMLAVGKSVAVIGLSNFGKSTLLRQMVIPQVAEAYRQLTGRAALFVFIDCNRMLEMSAQGFYEVILRAVLETLDSVPAESRALYEQIERFYHKVVDSSSSFAIPLAFNDAIITLLDERDSRDVILLLDEFDAVVTGLDERVFLNMRALKDKYDGRLNYVTATLKPLPSVGIGDDLAEFSELFVAHKYYLKPLDEDAATELAADIFQRANDHLDPPERDYILAQAGGHPGLIEAVAHVVMQVESGAPATYTQQALSMAGDVLQNHLLVRGELSKLWKQLLPDEREATSLAASRGVASLALDLRGELLARGLLIQGEEGPRLFSQLFTHYARRQGLIRQEVPDGVWVDIDAGTVWVSGQIVEALTDLEYRLLLLLYGRIGKICDKFQIVEAVWGQEYLGDVDDARIEKLVSRLRLKLEPDPAQPQYISTVRGRGYRLNPPGGMASADAPAGDNASNER
jgi:DNA-binding winged helix-turn-helix (wHTH) protein/GTP-binding protein EngB required for normal cell division